MRWEETIRNDIDRLHSDDLEAPDLGMRLYTYWKDLWKVLEQMDVLLMYHH